MTEAIQQDVHPRVYAYVTTGLDALAGALAGGSQVPFSDAIDLSLDVIAVQGGRSHAQPVGMLSITLLPRSSNNRQTPADIARTSLLYRQLDYAIISVGFELDGGVGLYMVTRRKRRTNRAGPNPSMSLTLECMDVGGRVLNGDNVIFASLSVQTAGKFGDAIAAALGDDSPLLVAFAGVWGPEGDDAVDRSITVTSPFTGETTVWTDHEKGTPTFLGQSVKDVLDWILAKAPSMRVPLLRAVGGDGRPSEFIRTDKSITTWNDARVWSDSPSTYNGNVFGFLGTVLDRDFYEIWIDYIPRPNERIPEIHLIVRPKPFDEPAMEFMSVDESTGITWDDLRTLIDGLENHDIPLNEVLSDDLECGDADAASYFMVTSQHDLIGNDESAKLGLAYPLVDTWMAKKCGLRAYNTRLSLLAGDRDAMVDGDADYDGELSSASRQFRNRLLNWYRFAPWFESGLITVRGRDRYRPGDPVRLSWVIPPRGSETGVRYYCTGVSWSWSLGSPYVSTLQVTRGHNAGVIAALRQEIEDDAPASNPSHIAES